MLVKSVKSGGVPSPISPSPPYLPPRALIVHQDVDRRLHHRQGVAEGDEPRMRTMGGYPYDLGNLHILNYNGDSNNMYIMSYWSTLW